MVDEKKYVSRGGLKLEAALDHFAIDVSDLTCADLGCSTGGFTDVLLSKGAKNVYAVDTAYGELDWKLRNDKRVVVMERTNAARVELPERVELVTIDISLVPLQAILPNVKTLAKPDAPIIALVKPQYQAKREDVPRGGVIKDEQVREKTLTDLIEWSKQNGFEYIGHIESPIRGKGGNVEYLVVISNKSGEAK